MWFFTPLNVITSYNCDDASTITFGNLINELKSYGYWTFGVNDVHSLRSITKLILESNKRKVYPIIGMTVKVYLMGYVVNLHLFAKNSEGYISLVKLLREEPRHLDEVTWTIEDDNLLKVLTCDEDEHVLRTLRTLKRQGYNDRVYLGLIDGRSVDEHVVTCATLGFQPIPFPPVRINHEHSFDSLSYVAASRNLPVPTKMNYTLQSLDKYYSEFKVDKYPVLSINLLNLVSQVRWIFPKFEQLVLESQSTYLEDNVDLIRKCVNSPKLKVSKEYWFRLRKEVAVIAKLRYASYFLLANWISRWCHKNSILCFPRGSAAGSYLAYLLDISHIDPIGWGLYFERFLNESRGDSPDFDLDLPSNHRHQVIRAITNKYSDLNKTCLIGTLNTMQPKYVLRTVGKRKGISTFAINNLCKEIVMISTKKVTLASSMEENLNLKNLLNNNPELMEVYREAKLIEGLPFTYGIHAAGITLIPKSKAPFLPITFSEEHQLEVVQLDKKEIEFFGLVKVDLLGVDSLSIIQQCCRSLNLNVFNLPLEDEVTFEGMRKLSTFSLFQISNKNSYILKCIQVSSISEIAEVLGLNRPGSMAYIPEYISRKNGEPFNLSIQADAFNEVVKDTLGIVIWQEQVMTLVIGMCGYSPHEADALRKVISKKEMSKMNAEREKILNGATQFGYSIYGEKIWNMVRDFQGYGFNKSHGVAYAHNTYYMAYFRYNHPKLFFLNSLNFESNPDKKILLVLDARSNGILILPPRIDDPKLEFYLDGDNIIFGVGFMKNLGQGIHNKLRQGTTLNDRERQNLTEAIENCDNWKVAMKYYGLTFDKADSSLNLHTQFFNYYKLDNVSQVDLRVVHVKPFYGPVEYDNKYVKPNQGDHVVKVTDGSWMLDLLVSKSLISKDLNQVVGNWFTFVLSWNMDVRKLQVLSILSS